MRVCVQLAAAVCISLPQVNGSRFMAMKECLSGFVLLCTGVCLCVNVCFCLCVCVCVCVCMFVCAYGLICAEI